MVAITAVAKRSPSILSEAAALPLDRSVVKGLLDPQDARDTRFAIALAHSLQSLPPGERRGALAGITGHVAESAIEVIFEGLGWLPVWHFRGPGRHGVDLLLLGPGAERMFAFEVKGTLRAGYWPRLRGGLVAQMDVAWLDKIDNPGMRDWGLASEDVYGGIALINFHDLAYKVALTSDFESWHPIAGLNNLEQLAWMDSA